MVKVAARIEVVAIVSSAGGLDAVSSVLRALPPDLGAAVVVAQHLGGQGSELVNILRRRIKRPVEWATAGDPLTTERVTVCPPRSVLEVLPDRTCAVRASEGTLEDPPLDGLLVSLADSVGRAGLAVVLTGMGSDGAAGVRAMKEADGVVIAQSEDTAEHPSMPRAAALAGADLVLPLHEIGGVVADVVAGGPLPRANDELAAIAATFGDEGEIAALARAIDWAATPLGAVRGWPEAQRAATRLAMDSPDGAALYFGESHIQLFNEATVPSLGGRHAEVFARPYADSYPELVGYMLPVLEQVGAGERVRHRVVRVPFERNGRLEDVWFDMSYRPVRAADGTIIGVYQALHERTDEVVSARRLGVLNRLAGVPTGDGRRQAIEAAVAALGEVPDIPFAAAYLIDRSGARAGLVAVAGVTEGEPMAPHNLPVARGSAWPLQLAIDSRQPVVIDDLATRFRGHQVGGDGKDGSDGGDGGGRLVVERALLYPLRDRAGDAIAGVLVMGATPRLPFDAAFQEFLSLAGETVTAKVAESHARQRERERIERMAQLDRDKTTFFSNISHEFRTPLTLMLGPLEALAADEGLADGRRADVDLVRRNARRLLRLVGTMLDFSQMEAGRLRARFEPVDLARSTREVVAQFHGAASQAGLELVVDVDPIDEEVWVDPDMWEKVVSNLVSNALKFTFEGTVEVRLRSLRQHAELVVRDTGVGIPAEEQPFVFKRFHRVRGRRARTDEGAGIGLALVDELVRRHHGRVRLVSRVDEGSAFTVWVPLGRRPAHPGDPGGNGGPSGTGGTGETGGAGGTGGAVAAALADEAARWHAEVPVPEGVDDVLAADLPLLEQAAGAHVLVVDDNTDMRDYLARLLGGTWRVTTARDGAEALEIARREPPDLVLADVMMPGLDGFELLRAMRQDEQLATVPVVLVTARAGEEAAVEGLIAGADDYVVKPFSARELVARAAAQLELSRLRRASERRFRALIDASWDVVYRMSPNWSEMRALDGRGFIVDTTGPRTSWLDEYIDPTDQPTVLDAIEDAIERRGIFELEHRVRRTDGTLGWTLSRAVPLFDDSDQLTEWVGAATDITERAEAMADLRGREDQFRRLLESFVQTVWETGPDGTVLADSASWREYTGQSLDEWLTDGWVGAVHPDDRAGATEQWRAALAAGTGVDADLRVRRAASDSWRWVNVRVVPLFDDDAGTIRRWAGMTIEIRQHEPH